MEQFLTVGDVAKLLAVHVDSIRHYANDGKLPAIRTRGGMRLFTQEDVEAFRVTRQHRAQAAAADAKDER